MSAFWTRFVRSEGEKKDVANMVRTICLAIALIFLSLFLSTSSLCHQPSVSPPTDVPGALPGR